jgi:hypothetical protein
VIPSIPRQTTTGNRFHIKSASLTLNGDTRPNMGAPASDTNVPLLRNSEVCVAPNAGRTNWNKFVGDGTGWNGSTVSNITYTYASVNCAAVAFNPTMAYSSSNSAAGQGTEFTANLTIPFDQSAVKAVAVTMPPFLAANTSAFGDSSVDQCPVEMIKQSDGYYNYFDWQDTASGGPCPAQAKVGTATLTTPVLDQTVSASVWLIEKAPIPNIGIKIDSSTPGNPQGVNIGLYGTTATVNYVSGCDPLFEDCEQALQAVFTSIPDVPVSSLSMTLGNQPGRIGNNGSPLDQYVLKNATPADSVCRNAGDLIKTTLVSWKGGSLGKTQLLQPTGCNQ